MFSKGNIKEMKNRQTLAKLGTPKKLIITKAFEQKCISSTKNKKGNPNCDGNPLGVFMILMIAMVDVI